MRRIIDCATAAVWMLLLGICLQAQQPCQSCHAAETKLQVATSMAHALSPAPASPILESHPILNFADGQTTYRIERRGDQVAYFVQRGEERLATLIQWAFGVGNVGQTFVYLKDGALYEGRVSFYRSLNGLDITNGQRHFPNNTISEAAGRLLSEDETTRCFGCHMTSIGENLIPGVQCQACHQNSDEHAASFATGKAVAAASFHSLNSLEMANFCGRCHRTYAGIQASGPKSVENVRFQPYRLVSSRCFNATDTRISCVACHNPHEEVRKTAAFYDAKCLACHSSQPKKASMRACPVAQKDCTSCHMPQVELPEMHNTFTDHRIRVVHKGEAYPS